MYHSTPSASATASRATDGRDAEKPHHQELQFMPAGWLKNKRKDKILGRQSMVVFYRT